jgi:hypothetical protein
MVKNKITFVCITLIFALSITGCSVFNFFKNIAQLKYKLSSVGNFQIVGIPVTNKTKLSDFNASDLFKLTSAFTRGKIPVTFVLNVEAFNPNTSDKSTDASVSITDFPWRLIIDDKETISGNINSPITIPGSNQTKIFPLQMEVDLFKFFGDQGYEKVINLALKLGNQGGSPADVKLVAQPTISSNFGKLKSPGEITIISKEFR